MKKMFGLLLLTAFVMPVMHGAPVQGAALKKVGNLLFGAAAVGAAAGVAGCASSGTRAHMIWDGAVIGGGAGYAIGCAAVSGEQGLNMLMKTYHLTERPSAALEALLKRSMRSGFGWGGAAVGMTGVAVYRALTGKF